MDTITVSSYKGKHMHSGIQAIANHHKDGFPFDEVFTRISSALGIHSRIELARLLSVRQSAISDARRRNAIPRGWLLKLRDQNGLNPDWLATGSGPMHTERPHVDTPACF